MGARAEIENTLTTWIRASDIRSLELKRSTLTEDTYHRVDLPNAEPVILHGIEAVIARFRDLWVEYPDSGLKHLLSNLVIEELTDDFARVWAYMTAIRPSEGNIIISSSATHLDELRKVDGKWLISSHYQHVELKPGGVVVPRLVAAP